MAEEKIKKAIKFLSKSLENDDLESVIIMSKSNKNEVFVSLHGENRSLFAILTEAMKGSEDFRELVKYALLLSKKTNH